ncbi:putative 2-dehydropantoate 2-reductase [Seiridium unicorne]|uniref:2-dehydropantoate 2-reductase n=1 Tax=Seiridium unicorne TaxID=138068 RepID=A0ABR2UFY3_9PEZI
MMLRPILRLGCFAGQPSSPVVQKSLSSLAHQGTPGWLQQILEDTSAPPKLYAWTAANLQGASTQAVDVCGRGDAVGRSSKERVYILGIGNLGRLIASSLAKLESKPAVTLILHRKALLEYWNSSPGIEITRAGQAERFPDFDVEWWTEEPPASGPLTEATAGDGILNLIVTTKASDALPQVDRLRKYLSGNSTVAFVQNGMCKMWPPLGAVYNGHRYPNHNSPNYMACVTAHGVTSLGPFKSRHASVVDLSVGPVSSDAKAANQSAYLAEQLVAAPYLYGKRVAQSELWVLQLEKLVVNSVINPLTAILRCKNGDLFVSQDTQLPIVIDMLIREASAVLKALVLHPSSAEILNDTSAVHTQTRRIPTSPAAQEAKEQLLNRFSFQNLRDMVCRVGHRVKENTSSMLQDVNAGKQTEIRDFNGWLVDTARLLDVNLELPTHKRLITMVEDGLVISTNQLGDHFDVSAEKMM